MNDFACIDAVELVTDFLDGALSGEQARRLERHLESCPGCSEYFEQLRTLAGGLSGLREESLSDELRARILASLRSPRD